jgi:hypothetical protein
MANAWINVDLGAPVAVNRVRMVGYNAHRGPYEHYVLYASVDNTNWTPLFEVQRPFEAGSLAYGSYVFPAVTARYIKAELKGRPAGNGGFLSEIFIYGPGTAPKAKTPAKVAAAPKTPAAALKGNN